MHQFIFNDEQRKNVRCTRSESLKYIILYSTLFRCVKERETGGGEVLVGMCREKKNDSDGIISTTNMF